MKPLRSMKHPPTPSPNELRQSATSIHASAFLKSGKLGAHRVESAGSEVDRAVNGWRKSQSRPDARTRRRFGSALIATLIGISTLTGSAQHASPAHLDGAEIQGAEIRGTVLSASGTPVSEASVKLEPAGARNPIETRTTAAGTFEFSALAAGSYTLSVEKSGLSARTAAIAVSEGDRKRVDVVLGASGSAQSSTPAMSFS